MSVGRKTLVVFMFHFVSDFRRLPEGMYRSWTVLKYYSDDCQTQNSSSYYVSLCFPIFAAFLKIRTLMDCSKVFHFDFLTVLHALKVRV